MEKKEQITGDALVLAALKYAANRGDDDAQKKVHKLEQKQAEKPVDEKPSIPKQKGNEVIEDIPTLWRQVKIDPAYFDGYTQLIKQLRKTEGRDEELREAYKMLLSEYPLCYGYWIRLASLEANTWQTTVEVYEEGLKYTPANPQLWISYLERLIERTETSVEEARAVMDRALNSCGSHWNSYNVWKCAIEYEERYLRQLSESELDHVIRLERQQACIARIRRLYHRMLSTPLSKLSSGWEKFKVLIGQGRTESETVSLDVTDLLVESELEAFQDFMMDNYVNTDKGSVALDENRYGRKENLLAQYAPMYQLSSSLHASAPFIPPAPAANNSMSAAVSESTKRSPSSSKASPSCSAKGADGAAATEISLKLLLPSRDTVSIAVDKNARLAALRQRAREALLKSGFSSMGIENKENNGRKQNEKPSTTGEAEDEERLLDLVYDGRVLSREGTVGEELVEGVKVLVFDGAALAKAMQAASGHAVEKWFLRFREKLYMKTCETKEWLMQFENKLKRTYFHPQPLDTEQLNVWRSYLDFVEEHCSEQERRNVYHRALEACCNYPEFWARYAKTFLNAGMLSAARHIYHYAAKRFLKRRPDMAFLYADFVERHGDATAAEKIIREVIDPDDGISPGLLEGYIRLVALLRRAGHVDQCEMVFEEAEQYTQANCKGRLAMEKAYFLLRYKQSLQEALNVLREQWQKTPEVGLLKYYVALLRRTEGYYEELVGLYEVAVNCSKMSVVNRWMIWKDYLYFVEHEASEISSLTDVKDRFSLFLHENAAALEASKRKRSAEESHEHRDSKRSNSIQQKNALASQMDWRKFPMGGVYFYDYNQLVAQQQAVFCSSA